MCVGGSQEELGDCPPRLDIRLRSSASRYLPLANVWQEKMRRKAAVMKNRLLSNARLRRLSCWLGGIQIVIEAREIAAGDVEPDPVAAPKQIAGCNQIICELMRTAGFHQSTASFSRLNSGSSLNGRCESVRRR